jgi:hypothetical protein
LVANRSYPYIIVLRRAGTNFSTDEKYRLRSTTASRAINRARKLRAEAEGRPMTQFVAIEAYRDRKRFQEPDVTRSDDDTDDTDG